MLIAFTSYWSVFEADALEANRANKRPLLEEQQIRRGLILARDGDRARAQPGAWRDPPRFYERIYPEGGLFAHPVGYSFVERGRVALEREYNDELTGKKDEFTSLLDELRGPRARGQRRRHEPRPGRRSRRRATASPAAPGAVVAIEPADRHACG